MGKQLLIIFIFLFVWAEGTETPPLFQPILKGNLVFGDHFQTSIETSPSKNSFELMFFKHLESHKALKLSTKLLQTHEPLGFLFSLTNALSIKKVFGEERGVLKLGGYNAFSLKRPFKKGEISILPFSAFGPFVEGQVTIKKAHNSVFGGAIYYDYVSLPFCFQNANFKGFGFSFFSKHEIKKLSFFHSFTRRVPFEKHFASVSFLSGQSSVFSVFVFRECVLIPSPKKSSHAGGICISFSFPAKRPFKNGLLVQPTSPFSRFKKEEEDLFPVILVKTEEKEFLDWLKDHITKRELFLLFVKGFFLNKNWFSGGKK